MTRVQDPRARGAVAVQAAAPATAVAAALVLWELAVRTGLVSSSLPAMSETMAELARQLADPAFWSAAGATLEGWALGLAVALALGIPAGVVIGSSRLAYRATYVAIEFLRPIPSVAIIPLVVLLYGVGLQSKVILVAFASLWPVLVATLYGVRDVDPVALDTARSFRVGRLERLYRVTLPAAVPFIATGVRISCTVALILAVTAELILGVDGLGSAISLAQSGGAFPAMYALIVATGVLGWLINVGAMTVERRVLHWRPANRDPAP